MICIQFSNFLSCILNKWQMLLISVQDFVPIAVNLAHFTSNSDPEEREDGIS